MSKYTMACNGSLFYFNIHLTKYTQRKGKEKSLLTELTRQDTQLVINTGAIPHGSNV